MDEFSTITQDQKGRDAQIYSNRVRVGKYIAGGLAALALFGHCTYGVIQGNKKQLAPIKDSYKQAQSLYSQGKTNEAASVARDGLKALEDVDADMILGGIGNSGSLGPGLKYILDRSTN
jgi:hypothetical protein